MGGAVGATQAVRVALVGCTNRSHRIGSIGALGIRQADGSVGASLVVRPLCNDPPRILRKLLAGLRALLSAMFPPECSEKVEREGLLVRRGLQALLSAMLPPESSENVEREGLRVHRRLQALLSVMLPPESSENVEQVGLRVHRGL